MSFCFVSVHHLFLYFHNLISSPHCTNRVIVICSLLSNPAPLHSAMCHVCVCVCVVGWWLSENVFSRVSCQLASIDGHWYKSRQQEGEKWFSSSLWFLGHFLPAAHVTMGLPRWLGGEGIRLPMQDDSGDASAIPGLGRSPG